MSTIDNEFGTTKILMAFYKALFAELQANHPDGRPPLRAGLYIRHDFIKDVLSELPDLYIWLIETRDGDLPEVEGETRQLGKKQTKQTISDAH